MNAGTKLAALNKFRTSTSVIPRPATKVLVVYDVQVKTSDTSHVSLIINYGECLLVEPARNADTFSSRSS